MKHTFILLLGAMLSLQGQAQDKQMQFQNTIKVEAGDSHADIIAKAAHVVPSPNQLAALQNEFIAFIHFGPNSFTRLEWGSGKEDPKVFDLKELDTDQWCEAMKAAGMKMVILTVKHHDGFVLWQSRYTKHGIMSTGFRDGKGDILKDLSESCRKYGLKFCHRQTCTISKNRKGCTATSAQTPNGPSRGKSPDGLLPTRPVSNS